MQKQDAIHAECYPTAPRHLDVYISSDFEISQATLINTDNWRRLKIASLPERFVNEASPPEVARYATLTKVEVRESEEDRRIVLAQGDVERALRCARWSSRAITLLRRQILHRGEDIRRRGESVAGDPSGGYHVALEKKFSLTILPPLSLVKLALPN